MRLLGTIVVTLALLVVPAAAEAQISWTAARLNTSASFSGLPARLVPDLTLTAPSLELLHAPPARDWFELLLVALPELELRTQLAPATSDEYRMRRFDGRGGHAQAAIFECPADADLVLFRLIGVFDAL